ncbi:hypothetical protein GOBAR_DD06369 [Gossypium barbadense]|nr:hypothetical protein GOBAR_DD06369 [Gossypium barbadense]
MEISLNSGYNISHLEIGDGDGSRTDVDRNTKKVHFKERNGEGITDMLVESGPSPILSWKDKLLGNKSGASNKLGLDNSGAGADEDLEFLEGDIHRSIVNGIPAIDFSERIRQILFKEMEHTYLTVQPWTKELNPLQPYPSMMMAWIRLLGLLGSLYKMKILEEIGETIGKVVWLDFNIDSRIRGRFARMAVYEVQTYQRAVCFAAIGFGSEEGSEGYYSDKGCKWKGRHYLRAMDGGQKEKDKLNKEDTRKLAGFKNKLKAGENVGQQGFKTRGQEVSEDGGPALSTKPTSSLSESVEVQVVDSLGGLNPNRHTTILFKEKDSTDGAQLRGHYFSFGC